MGEPHGTRDLEVTAWYRPGGHEEHRDEGAHHDDDDAGGAGGVPTTSLLREARGAYAHAVRAVLDLHGVGDVPPNSAFLLGGLRAGVPYEDLVRQRRRGLERGNVVDALVDAGCVKRVADDVVLTDRGREVATACAAARDRLDRHVVEAIGVDGYATMRAGLVALIGWKEEDEQRR